MSEITFVTSFSEQGYDLYGKAFMESFVEHVDARLLVYYETRKPPTFKHKNIEYVSLSKVPGVVPLLQAMQVFPVMQGVIQGKRVYQYDIYKFCRKIFAQCDAATKADGLMCWIDADVVFEKNLHMNWIVDLMKEREDGLSPFVAVMKRPSWHICASFVVWNLQHEQSIPFWNAYYDLIISGRFLLLQEWHDSFLLEMVINGMELDCKDIAESYELDDGPINVFDIVFQGVARHKKGNIKHREKHDQRIDTQPQPA